MLTLGRALDAAEVLRWVGRIAGDEDPHYDGTAFSGASRGGA